MSITRIASFTSLPLRFSAACAASASQPPACITIRTALIKDGKAYVQAGGGWVNDSTPEGEYQETINKSLAMRKAIAMAENFSAE